MSISIGQQAPDFTLRDTEKNKITLAEHKGKNVLLLFFPLAFTSTCTKELCMMRDNFTGVGLTLGWRQSVFLIGPHCPSLFLDGGRKILIPRTTGCVLNWCTQPSNLLHWIIFNCQIHRLIELTAHPFFLILTQSPHSSGKRENQIQPLELI